CSATPSATRRAAAKYESRRPGVKITYQFQSPTRGTAFLRNISRASPTASCLCPEPSPEAPGLGWPYPNAWSKPTAGKSAPNRESASALPSPSRCPSPAKAPNGLDKTPIQRRARKQAAVLWVSRLLTRAVLYEPCVVAPHDNQR